MNRPDLIWERLGMRNILRKWFPSPQHASILTTTSRVLGEFVSGKIFIMFNKNLSLYITNHNQILKNKSNFSQFRLSVNIYKILF